MFELIKPGTKIDFLGRAKYYYIISISLCLISLALFFTKGFTYGVDFSGGTVVQVRFENPPSVDEMRSVLNSSVPGKVSIQNFGEDTDFLIKSEDVSGDLKGLADLMQSTLLTSFKDTGAVTIQRVEQVGPQVGKELKTQAAMAVLYAIIGILIYVAFRFQFIYSLGAIIALIHDIIVTIGVIIIANVTFDLTVLAALLTVVGYSLNDKIVVFDRIREKLKENPDSTLFQIMNMSINETLSRTLLTSVSTLLAVVALYIFGGEVISGFALTMLAGIVIGTYSSIGISSASVYVMKNLLGKRKKTANAKS